MAHFVKLDSGNQVVDCIVVDNGDAPDPSPGNSEPQGQQFIASLAALEPRLEGAWLQTSYSGRFRKQYAGIGYHYDSAADVFIAPQPFPSWSLDSNHDWQPPTPMPSDGGPWFWDEATTSWQSVT